MKDISPSFWIRERKKEDEKIVQNETAMERDEN